MIIGLMGYARSGKDTLADAFIEAYPALGFRKVALADKLRDAAYDLNPVVDGTSRLSDVIDTYGWDGYKDSRWADPVREYLQDLGLAVRTHCGESTWLLAALSHDAVPDDDNVIVTDVRFKNEAAYIRYARDGLLVSVDRPGTGPANDHVSENQAPLYPDIRICNEADSADTWAARGPVELVAGIASLVEAR